MNHSYFSVRIFILTVLLGSLLLISASVSRGQQSVFSVDPEMTESQPTDFWDIASPGDNTDSLDNLSVCHVCKAQYSSNDALPIAGRHYRATLSSQIPCSLLSRPPPTDSAA